jgi:hypothetical protein
MSFDLILLRLVHWRHNVIYGRLNSSKEVPSSTIIRILLVSFLNVLEERVTYQSSELVRGGAGHWPLVAGGVAELVTI